MKKIVVIGSLNVDYVIDVHHIPTAGETILSKELQIVPGGKGANQACALARMGADVTMLGLVGNDGNGTIELESLRAAGVDISHVERVPQATGLAVVAVNKEGNNSIIVVQGANAVVSREYIDAKIDVIKAADIVLMQLEIPLDTVLHAARIAKEYGKTVILDPAPAPEQLPQQLLAYADVVKPNEIELAMLTGMQNAKDDPRPACELLRQCGVGTVVASLGSQGAFVLSDEIDGELFPSEKTTVVDTTAAGDSFTAAVAYALSRGQNMRNAVRFANRVGAVVVSRRGAQSSIPTPEEIERLWSECGLP